MKDIGIAAIVRGCGLLAIASVLAGCVSVGLQAPPQPSEPQGFIKWAPTEPANGDARANDAI